MKQLVSALDKLGLSLQTFKTALASALAWIVAHDLFAFPFPYFAPLSAMLTVQVSVADSWEKAAQRIIGLIGGVLVSLVISHWFPLGTVSIFLTILLGMALAKVFRMNSQIISQVAVSSFLVLAFGSTKGYVINRIFETFLGSGIAIAVNALIVPQKTIPTMYAHIRTLSELSSSALLGLISLLDSAENNQAAREKILALVAKTEETALAGKTTEKALRYTPFLSSVKKRLAQLNDHVVYLEHITVQIRGMRRGIFDLYSEMNWQPSGPVAQSLKASFASTADCITAYGKAVISDSPEDKEELADKIEHAKLVQLQCLAEIQHITALPILRDMGSVLTDLKRILKELELEKTQ